MSTVDDLKAGRELDRLVGEKVMGCRVKKRRGAYRFVYDLVVPGSFDRVDYVEEAGAWSAMPAYSTDIAMAWKIVEKFGFMVHPTGNGPHRSPAAYWVGFPRDGHMGLVGDMENETVACAPTAPHAIALAALKEISEP